MRRGGARSSRGTASSVHRRQTRDVARPAGCGVVVEARERAHLVVWCGTRDDIRRHAGAPGPAGSGRGAGRSRGGGPLFAAEARGPEITVLVPAPVTQRL